METEAGWPFHGPTSPVHQKQAMTSEHPSLSNIGKLDSYVVCSSHLGVSRLEKKGEELRGKKTIIRHKIIWIYIGENAEKKKRENVA